MPPTNTVVVGNATKKAEYDVLFDYVLSLAPKASVPTTVGTQTALAIPVGAGDLTYFANNATLLTVQGIAAGLDGQSLTIISTGAGQVDFSHQNGSAPAANRLVNTVTSGLTSLAAGTGKATYTYDAAASRWRLERHEQGADITPAYNAGDFTASAGTWGVDAIDLDTFTGCLRGRQLTVKFFIKNTDVSSTPTGLRFVIPGGFTCVKRLILPIKVDDAAGGISNGWLDVAASGTFIALFKDTGTWTATSSDNTNVYGEAVIEVQ